MGRADIGPDKIASITTDVYCQAGSQHTRWIPVGVYIQRNGQQAEKGQ